ncbi:MAG: adenylyltransferase/cytidyltransferase family protein [Puniceicoccales bacterium]|jgi:riboflavin kinase/FMN adenylyltransferase|nr:adenylyltransferase/cytidyltransferase family protein [Puniceicoccales bacterium]
MKIIRTLFDAKIAPLVEKKVVLAIGVFDGVHSGHRFLLKQTMNFAEKMKAVAVVYTFWPHPSHFYAKDQKKMITDNGQKFEILATLGLPYAVEQCFDGKFAAVSYENFIEFLKKKFRFLAGICVGSDFRFGHKREGNVFFLQKLCETANVALLVVDEFCIDGERVSSSKIRALLDEHNFTVANRLLGSKIFR